MKNENGILVPSLKITKVARKFKRLFLLFMSNSFFLSKGIFDPDLSF